jgi:hypothetical protein
MSSAHCAQVREALTLLDLDVLIYPCPKGGPTYRPQATEMSGKAQFPFLVDPNTGSSPLDIIIPALQENARHPV